MKAAQATTKSPRRARPWSSITETLYDKRRIRLLTIIDESNRESLEIAMGVSLPSRLVVRVLNELVAFESIAELRVLTDAWLRV